MLVGTAGPAQKLIVQLWNQSEIVGYLKYGESAAAKDHIIREAGILKGLPSGLGPTLLKCGPLENGLALVLTAVHGQPINAQLPVEDKILLLLETFRITAPLPFWEHPWITKVKANIPSKICLTSLAGRKWPVVFHHGDFAPWNILSRPDGSLGVIDWEYGTDEGFPFLDFVFFVLQVGRLIYRWPPQKAKCYSIKALSLHRTWNITEDQAKTLVCLCAYHTYSKALPGNDATYYESQDWWRAVWNNKT